MSDLGHAIIAALIPMAKGIATGIVIFAVFLGWSVIMLIDRIGAKNDR